MHRKLLPSEFARITRRQHCGVAVSKTDVGFAAEAVGKFERLVTERIESGLPLSGALSGGSGAVGRTESAPRMSVSQLRVQLRHKRGRSEMGVRSTSTHLFQLHCQAHACLFAQHLQYIEREVSRKVMPDKDGRDRLARDLV